MPKIGVQQIGEVSEGTIQKVGSKIVLPNSVYLAVNLLFHKDLGKAVVRDGTTLLGSQISAGNNCDGLSLFAKNDGTIIPLAAFNGTIYKYTASAWSSSKTGLTAGEKTHFVQFLNVITVVNGTDSAVTFNGTNWTDTTVHDTSNFPATKYTLEFQDRIYAAGNSTYPDRLYYSSTPSSGNISWTSGNGYIDVEAEEQAGPITGLAKVPGYLLVFKARSLKRWDTQSTYPESLITIGAPSQEAVVMARQSVFYFNKRGIYETVGSFPRKISRRVQDIIDAIPSTYYSSVSGYGDGENVLFSIGDITLGDLTLTNCVLLYRIEEKQWTLLSFPDEFLAWSNYVDSNGKEFILAGDDDGQVWKVLEGTGDANADIRWLLQYQEQEFGSRGRIKNLSKMVVYTKQITNGQMSVKTDNEDDFQPVKGVINKSVQEIIHDLNGRYFSFRIQGKGTKGEIIGIDFPEASVNLSFKK